jgi:uncharacterized peroxidase-related enzyme
MSWITEIEETDATGEIASVYERLREERGRVANILKVHSLRAPALVHHLDLYMGLLFGPGGLGRGQRELIAVVVSRANQCDYCVNHHVEALSRYVRDPEKLRTIAEDYRAAQLKPAERALAGYAHKLTVAPASMTENDIQSLRQVGLVDADILLANLIVAYFNFVNRIALGLGVAYTLEEVQGYKV